MITINNTFTIAIIIIAIISVSNGSGLPGFGPYWNGPEVPDPGQKLPSYLTRVTSVQLLPGPDINPRFFGLVEPQTAVPNYGSCNFASN